MTLSPVPLVLLALAPLILGRGAAIGAPRQHQCDQPEQCRKEHELCQGEIWKRLNDARIEVSLFIAPEPAQVEASAKIGSQFIELHTGSFAEEFSKRWGEAAHEPKRSANEPAREDPPPTGSPELLRLISGATQAHALGLRVNAGHGLSYANLPALHHVPHLVELNIGHSIVSRAVTVGLEAAVKEMLRLMENYPE